MAPRQMLRRIGYVPRLLRRSLVKGWNDRLLGLSAEAAFWQLLSLPSLFIALVAALGYVSRWFGPQTTDRTEKQLKEILGRAFSHQVVQNVIGPVLHDVLHGSRASVISIGFVVALWAGSSATATFVNTITIAYDMRDQRGPIRSRLLALGLFLCSVVVGVFALPMLVLGPSLITRAFPERLQHTASTIINAAYYPVLVLLLLVGLTTLYHLAPPRRLPWRRGVPGALFAILIFIAGSVALRAYINFILDHNHSYGTLAAPIAALLFFYVLALGVLLGAEFNAAIEALAPSPVKPPRVLDPRNWHRLHDNEPDEEPEDDESGHPPQSDIAS
jgi:membrane protein